MSKKSIRALLGYMKGYRWLVGLGLLFIVGELFLSFISPLIMSVTIDSILDSNDLALPSYFAWFIELCGGQQGLRDNIFRALIIMAAAMVVLRIVSGVMTFMRTYANSRAAEGTTKRLRDRVYAHIQKLPFRYHVTAQTGDLIQRATNDVDTVRRFVSGTMLEFVRTSMLFVVGIFVMANLHVELTIITMSMAPVIVGVSFICFKRVRKLIVSYEEQEGKMYTVAQENLTGTRVVRAFGRQRFELDKFLDSNEELRRRTIKLNSMFASMWSALDAVGGIQVSLVTVFGIIFAVNGSLSLGEYVAFTSYVYIFMWPLRNFGRVLSSFSSSLIAVSRISEILDQPEEDMVESGVKPPLCGDIEFRDVCFSYDEGQQVLKNLNMSIAGGSTIAILGGTGSGKSTVAQLLQRLYDLKSGEIRVGGVDVADMSKQYLRDRIGIVLQEPFLYSKTILDNIGIKMEKPDRDRISDAAKVACIHDDIEEFENGYDTMVGERGVTLSGGQKQRVAIARALVNDSDILIFDDSLSAVDSKTDAAIRHALKERRKGTTTIIISHRITTLMEADRIFVLQNGAVVEQGNHDQLLEQGGIYRRTYDIQSAHADEVSA